MVEGTRGVDLNNHAEWARLVTHFEAVAYLRDARGSKLPDAFRVGPMRGPRYSIVGNERTSPQRSKRLYLVERISN